MVYVHNNFQAIAGDDVWSAVTVSTTCRLLPLPCNACISVMSECRQSDSITVSHDYHTLCCCLRITFEQSNKRWWNLCRNIGSNLGCSIIRARSIKFHTTPLVWLTPKSSRSISTRSQKRMTMAMKFNINISSVEVENYLLHHQQSIGYVTIGLTTG